MNLEDRFFRRDPARLLPVRPRMSLNESRRELFQCGHLLLDLGPAVLQHVPLAILAPSVGG
jgi:hypothetical protein